ncbi:pentapeptide repeat-containing protein [Amycolatopsis regifaucium]|nr:pentapeptide repeat-containing protein [Amycolatopsis regifaucium]
MLTRARFRRHSPSAVSWWHPVLVLVVPVVVVIAIAVFVFLRVLEHSSSSGRLELIRTALAVGAGTGAIMTLVLAWRRQWSAEHDAAERRLTELYVKAVEQLGSDQAPVRHGALYALERVAQDNPDHRQTVVDVICAYLRAPYIPPADKPGARRLGGLAASPRKPRTRGALPRRNPIPSPTADGDERRQEREVRLTAQRILTRHLDPGDRPRRPLHTFWPGIDLDLSAATLINLDLRRCHVRTATFTGATFIGWAGFSKATFTAKAGFSDATFTGNAWFSGATFAGYAWFSGATFIENAWFGGATFTEYAGFEEATFGGDAGFKAATFGAGSWNGAWFSQFASMVGATADPSSAKWPPGWALKDAATDRKNKRVPLIPEPAVLPA